MTSINDAYVAAKNYWDQIPQNTGMQVARAAGIAFIIETIFTGNIKVGITGAALATLATAIHGAVSPLFLKFTQGRTQINWNEEMGRTCIALIGTAAIAQACGNNALLQKISALAIFFGILTYFEPQRCNLAQTNCIFV